MVRKHSHNANFEQFLVEKGKLTLAKLKEVNHKIKNSNKTIEQVLLESHISSDELSMLKAEFSGHEFIHVARMPIPQQQIWRYIKLIYVKKHKALPINYENHILTVVIADAEDTMVLEDIKNAYMAQDFLIKKINIVISTPEQINEAIKRFYRATGQEIDIDDVMDQVEEKYRPEIVIADIKQDEVNADSDPIVQLANRIVEEAAKKNASDIHLEPDLNYLRVRYRIDGGLIEVVRIP